jgi:hypothetical protein
MSMSAMADAYFDPRDRQLAVPLIGHAKDSSACAAIVVIFRSGLIAHPPLEHSVVSRESLVSGLLLRTSLNLLIVRVELSSRSPVPPIIMEYNRSSTIPNISTRVGQPSLAGSQHSSLRVAKNRLRSSFSGTCSTSLTSCSISCRTF